MESGGVRETGVSIQEAESRIQNPESRSQESEAGDRRQNLLSENALIPHSGF